MTLGNVLYDALGRPQGCSWATLPFEWRLRYAEAAKAVVEASKRV